MGWSGSLSASSAVGSAITFTPDTTTDHGYTVSAFTAPKKGVYQFILKGSGGKDSGQAAGGTGGTTTGYLLLEANQTVYVGAGGMSSAAFVGKVTGAALKNIAKENLYFVAGAAGGGGGHWNDSGSQPAGRGGNGGGESGVSGNSYIGSGGPPGTQTTGGNGGNDSLAGSYGAGGLGQYWNDGSSHTGGDGGDGLYGGSAGGGSSGGGGGSGYVHVSSLKVGSKTYTNATQQGGGAGSNSQGSVQVSYHARAELPIIFNGTTLERLFFNGVEVESLIYDGVKLFFRKLRRWGRCLNSAEPVSA